MALTHTHTDTLDADTLAWLDDAGEDYNDDESDFSTRYADIAPEYADAPRVVPIAKPAPPHVPGVHFEVTSCLCSCHFGKRTREGGPACDDRECMAWGRQNAAKAKRESERKIAQWTRKQERRAATA